MDMTPIIVALIAAVPALTAVYVSIVQGRKNRAVNTEEHGGTDTKLDILVSDMTEMKATAYEARLEFQDLKADVRALKADVRDNAANAKETASGVRRRLETA